MRPPRALWVTFELGRPLGPPNDREFQRGVLLATLRLLEAAKGPILDDYPFDAPARDEDQQPWVCPLSFAREQQTLEGAERVTQLLLEEFASLRPWFERASGQSGRTSFGASGLELDEIAKLLGGLFESALPPSPRSDLSLADVIRLSLEDLKTYYFEAAAAQPGSASAADLRRWFWRDTQAADVVRELGDRLRAMDDPALKLTGEVFVVPRAEA
ncbi:MAG: hypothetical protein ACPHUF_07495 [Gammaproteobacteria bacterium]